jgi:hypothetical protein
MSGSILYYYQGNNWYITGKSYIKVKINMDPAGNYNILLKIVKSSNIFIEHKIYLCNLLIFETFMFI